MVYREDDDFHLLGQDHRGDCCVILSYELYCYVSAIIEVGWQRLFEIWSVISKRVDLLWISIHISFVKRYVELHLYSSSNDTKK